MTDRNRTRIQLLLAPDFNLAATAGFVDPFRAANYLEGEQMFAWEFLAEAGGPVRASNGARLDARALADSERDPPPDFLLVSSNWTPEAHVSGAMKAALQRAERHGATLGGIDTGAFVLAMAGPMSGYRATAHYEHIDTSGNSSPTRRSGRNSGSSTATHRLLRRGRGRRARAAHRPESARPRAGQRCRAGSGADCDMSVYSLDTYASVRPVMIAHSCAFGADGPSSPGEAEHRAGHSGSLPAGGREGGDVLAWGASPRNCRPQ